MKKIISLLIAAAMLLCLFSGCSKVSLEGTQEELEEAYLGKTIGEIHKALGEPDGFLSGLWGEIYHRGENEMVIFYYKSVDGGYNDDSGVVEHILITERQVSE